METSGGFLRRRMCWFDPPVLLWDLRTSCSCLGPGGSTNRFIWSTWRHTSTSGGHSRWVFWLCGCVFVFFHILFFWRVFYFVFVCSMYACGFFVLVLLFVFCVCICRYIGMLARSKVGTSVHGYVSISVRRYVGTSICRYVGKSLRRYMDTSTRLRRYVGM